MEIDLLSTKLIETQEKRLALENLYRQIANINENEPLKYERIPSILQHPLVSNIKEKQVEIAQKKNELGKRYGNKHPKMIAINSELDTIDRTLIQQMRSIVDGIENDYKIAVAGEQSVRSELDKRKLAMQVLMQKNIRLSELEQEVKIKQQLYDTFLTRYAETNATDGLETSRVRIIDPAVRSINPAKPRKMLIIAIAFIVSLLLSTILVFLREELNDKFRIPSDIDERFELPFLGQIPLLNVSVMDMASGRIEECDLRDSNQFHFVEAFRTLRTSISLSSLDRKHKIIGITSTKPEEGKTFVAINLSASFKSN